MATMKITLTNSDIGQACQEYIAKHFNVSVREVTLSASPCFDQTDRPTGTYSLTATATVQHPLGYTGDGKT